MFRAAPLYRTLAALALGALALTTLDAQVVPIDPVAPPDIAPPPPLPSKPVPTPKPRTERLIPESDAPWGLEEDVLTKLADKARQYAAYATRFDCVESARLANYNRAGEAENEQIRRYGYILVREDNGSIREVRQRVRRSGGLSRSESEDKEPFPPAYAWVFLFSDFHQPYFSYRDMGDRFDGFDWVREIQFRGTLGFTDGDDIRQWEGIVTVDAATFTPIQIQAQPRAQDERIKEMYDRWAQSFNLIGFKLGPRPLGYRSKVQFRMRKDELTFPTEVRYDTFRATSPTSRLLVKASTRSYDAYKFFKPSIKDFQVDPGSAGSR
ncbi:hypothetical protein ABI59_21035 [Acidobacteria bacterium Mor1]|nr:hypothetical protein ABI59_21035 [Acidobacteria bacterium Mor1]